MSSFNIDDLIEFLKLDAHIRNGVILYSNLKNWSIQETQFKIGEFKFLNIEERCDEPSIKYAKANHNEIDIKIELREPEYDAKGNFIANSIKVTVSIYGVVSVSRILTDVLINIAGSSIFEDTLINMMIELQKERFNYLVKGVGVVCIERNGLKNILEG